MLKVSLISVLLAAMPLFGADKDEEKTRTAGQWLGQGKGKSLKESDYKDTFLVRSAGADRDGACWMTLEIDGRTFNVSKATYLLSRLSPCHLFRSGEQVKGRFRRSFQHGRSVELLYRDGEQTKAATFEINSMYQ